MSKEIMAKTLKDVGEFAKGDPFNNIKEKSYGVIELCVFSALEYCNWLLLHYNNDVGKEWYYQSIEARSDKKTADGLIPYYNNIQRNIARTLKKSRWLEEKEDDERIEYIMMAIAFHTVFPYLATPQDLDRAMFRELLEKPEEYIEKKIANDFDEGTLDRKISTMLTFAFKHFLNTIMEEMNEDHENNIAENNESTCESKDT